jgi:hypothetical protein
MSTGRLGAGDNAIQSTLIDAKGDLVTATAADTPARLAVGTNNYFLQAASGQSTGLQWGGSWTSYTPTWTGISLGNGTSSGRYIKVGKTVTLEATLTFGSTTSVTGGISVSLPSGSTINFATQAIAWIFDSGIGHYIGVVWSSSAGSTDVEIRVMNASSTYVGITPISSTVPMTWNTSDEIRIFMTYEEQ